MLIMIRVLILVVYQASPMTRVADVSMGDYLKPGGDGEDDSCIFVQRNPFVSKHRL